MADSTLGAYNIADLREMARRRLPKGVFEFVDRGTEDEVALRNNRAALGRIGLKPRTLVNVSGRSQEITLFGRKQPMPIVVGPTGTAGLLAHDGEIGVARAAAAAGIPFTVATNSMTSMEAIAERAGGRLWFQLYMVDSGFRRGADVVKALALGASAVLIGRAPLYGVAAGGEAGAARAIAIFREEIDRVMALLGARSTADLDRRFLRIE